jgi:hypothetical protein
LVDHKWQGLTSEYGTLEGREYLRNVQAHEIWSRTMPTAWRSRWRAYSNDELFFTSLESLLNGEVTQRSGLDTPLIRDLGLIRHWGRVRAEGVRAMQVQKPPPLPPLRNAPPHHRPIMHNPPRQLLLCL